MNLRFEFVGSAGNVVFDYLQDKLSITLNQECLSLLNGTVLIIMIIIINIK